MLVFVYAALVICISASPFERSRGRPLFLTSDGHTSYLEKASPIEVLGTEVTLHQESPQPSLKPQPHRAASGTKSQHQQTPVVAVVEARHSQQPEHHTFEVPSHDRENLLLRSVVVPANAKLLRTSPSDILSRLPDNATLLRPNIVDTFSCAGRFYGYYADPDNDCQIFHVCLPLHTLYPSRFKSDTTYQFSFICGNTTRFDQASMACVHEDSFTCDNPEMYYYLNHNFFRKIPSPSGETQWAWVNADVPKDYVYKPEVEKAR